jgi:hypothetical protein
VIFELIGVRVTTISQIICGYYANTNNQNCMFWNAHDDILHRFDYGFGFPQTFKELIPNSRFWSSHQDCLGGAWFGTHMMTYCTYFTMALDSQKHVRN